MIINAIKLLNVQPFHSLNFFKSFKKRFEREPTRGALQDNLIFLLSCPFFMMLQPMSIQIKWNND